MAERGSSKILVTCAKGIPPVLAGELRKLGYEVEQETIAGVETRGTLHDSMKMNLFLRTGQRVLFLLEEFIAQGPDELYSKIYAIPWDEFIDEDGYFCVTSSVDNPNIRDSRYANLKCKDAIADRIRERYGRRPDSGSQRNGTVVHLYWKGSACSVYLDTSGEPLSRRGYRKIPLQAPMQESLAAAVILSTGWDGKTNFINPMCGSGTLAIEAALIGLRRAAGSLRTNFGFMHLKGFRQPLWNTLKIQAESDVQRSIPGLIIATDNRPEAIEAARINAEAAGVENLISFSVCDFAETVVPNGEGVVIINPEYGERMGRVLELEDTYRSVGDFLKQKCLGYSGYIFTGNPVLAKKVGLRARSRKTFYNGEIECRLQEYELYEGSRRRGKNETE